MFVRKKKVRQYHYLELIESYREKRTGKVKKRKIANLGRADSEDSIRTAEKIVAALKPIINDISFLGKDLDSVRAYALGPGLVFQRLWERLDLPGIFGGLLRGRKFQFSVERAVFLEVLHRLFHASSDRDAMSWREDYEIPDTCDIQLQHLYRSMKFLGENKNKIEEHLFQQNRDLFNHTVDLVFFDTTSLYFESEKESDLKKRGYSKDHRSDALQVVFGVLLDKDGRPIASEILPGNTADVTIVQPLINRLQRRFKIRRVVFVGDRGFTSNENLEAFEQAGFEYIAGVKMRNLKETKEVVLPQANGFDVGADDLQVQEIFVEDRKYIVCCNPEQKKRDAYVREELIKSLESALQHGSKKLVSNKGYRKYAKIEKDAISIDEEKIATEEMYDGIWVLRTNTDLSASETALQYKRLWQVEQFFRNTKSMFDTRPIYHQNDKHIIGHIFISFLAFLLRYELYKKLEEKNVTAKNNRPLPWQAIKQDLEALQRIIIEDKGNLWRIRSDAQGFCNAIFQSVGIAFPRRIEQIQNEDNNES